VSGKVGDVAESGGVSFLMRVFFLGKWWWTPQERFFEFESGNKDFLFNFRNEIFCEMTCRFHEIKTTLIWRPKSYFEYSFPFVGTIVIRPTWKENRDTGWD
jgi:hypothetical protein